MTINIKSVKQTGSGTSPLLVIKDISDEYVTFEGELVRSATRWEPEERRTVELPVADVLNADKVFLVSSERGCVYIDDSFDDAPAGALKSLTAGKANEAEIKEIEQWMAEIGPRPEKEIWKKITTRGQEDYNLGQD